MILLTDLIISLGVTIIGAFAGWSLNEYSTFRRERPKLRFQMMHTPENTLTEKTLRTKTSISEYSIEIFNVGKNTFILDYFSLIYKDKLLIDCFIDADKRVILPNENIVYTLMEQDTNALQYHCNQYQFEKCDVIAYSIDGKKAKGKLELPLFTLQANFTYSNGLYRR